MGQVVTLFIGMECDGAPVSWIYGPLFGTKLHWDHDRSRQMSGSDCEKAMDLVRMLKPREVYVYAMGMEPWLNYISRIHYAKESRPLMEAQRFIQSCRQKGILAEQLYGEKQVLVGSQPPRSPSWQ